MKKSDLAELAAELRRDLNETRAGLAMLRAWQEGHMCAQQPQAVSLPGIYVTCTCGTSVLCPVHGSCTISRTVTGETSWSASAGTLALHQVWPPKPDDPGTGVPAVV